MTTVMTTAPLHPALGVEVQGADVRGLTGDDLLTLAGLLLRHGVVVLRGQQLTLDDHVEFTAQLGEPEGFTRRGGTDGGVAGSSPKNLFRVSNDASLGTTGVGFYWHADGYFYQQPTAVSLMRPLTLPAAGGATKYASMSGALRAMPERLRAAVADRVALARPKPGTRGGGMLGRSRGAAVRHPLVRAHPVTGVRGLFLNARNMAGIESLTRAESDALVAQLCDFLDTGDFVYTHRWQPGDLVLWDNSGVLHQATPVLEGTRVMERTSVSGSAFLDGGLWTRAWRAVPAAG